MSASAIVLLLVFVAVGSTCWDDWVMAAMTPTTSFGAAMAPSPPDYADPAFWTAHAAKDGPAAAAPAGYSPVDPNTAPVAVFYVHPTSYLGPAWNGPVDDPELNAQTDELSTLIQASAFNGCCAVFGPRYRQANGQAFVTPGPDADSAIALAYGDVLIAFHHFLREESRGRPFILASHSQGSALAARLLREEILGRGLQGRLVVAYLIGGPIDEEQFSGLRACDAADETSCVVGWNARGPRFRGSAFDFQGDGTRLCVNPLSWRHDEAPAMAALNRGAVFLHAGDGTPLSAYADATCRDGLLIVESPIDPPRDFMSSVLDFVVGPENYHPIDYQLFYMNLRENAQTRVAAYLGAHARPE